VGVGVTGVVGTGEKVGTRVFAAPGVRVDVDGRDVEVEEIADVAEGRTV